LPVDRAAIDCARATVLRGDPGLLSPDAVFFLLREYVSAGNEDVRAAVEQGLTRGLDALHTEADPCRRLEWLRVLAEASAISDDERLREDVERALPGAVDGLEALVRHSYEPGEGLLDASCAAQLQCASALLAAFDLSGRLPYAMLAEELLQYARRRWWAESTSLLDADFGTNCTALRLLCRMAALHADPAYRAAAVLVPGSTTRDDARRLATTLISRSALSDENAAEFGLALLAWFALDADLQ
jgi:hypothetical protein